MLRDLQQVRESKLSQIHAQAAAAADARRDFARLRELRDDLAATLADPGLLAELSMGMSGDFEAAILEGATIVRIGSALFEGVGGL